MLSSVTSAGDISDLIAEVKANVNCQLLIPEDDSRVDFGRYQRQRCFNPEHTDSTPSLLIFPDGYTCTSGCGMKAGDAIDYYRMVHPEVGIREAALKLLASPELTLVGGISGDTARNSRVLDPDLPLKYHFALAADKVALAGLMQMGFTPQAIQHFKLGYAEVGVRLENGTFEQQKRYSVPVYVEGRLRQILYRKSRPEDGGSKITMERDAGSHLFGVDELANASTALFVEGWGDKLICWQWGFTAVTSTNGAGHWNSDWTEHLGGVRRLYVVGDADNAGQKMVTRMKRDLPWIRPLALPWPVGTKKDLRDGWLAGWRKADVLKLMRQADIAGSWSVVAKTGASK